MARRNPRTPAKKHSPECPDCGHAYCTQIDSGWANDSTILVRLYTCPEECPVFITAEMAVATNVVSIAQFDEHYRAQRRLQSRKQQGYHGTKVRGGTITKSATIVGQLTATPAERYGYPKPTTTKRKTA